MDSSSQPRPEIRLRRSMSQTSNEKWIQDMHTPSVLIKQKSRLAMPQLSSPRSFSHRSMTPLSLTEFGQISEQVDEHLAEEQLKRSKLMEVLGKVEKVVSDSSDTQQSMFEHMQRLMDQKDKLLLQVELEREQREQVERRNAELDASCRTLTQELSRVLDAVENKFAKKTREMEKEFAERLHHERQQRMCWLCMTAPRDTVVLPCFHFMFCYTCVLAAQSTQQVCPHCEQPLSGVLKCQLE